ncbi:MAG: LPS-assembly protein LptD [Rhizobiaceae bacterium]|nr:LPS-assembly protein LptD [Rhizobiaceae bacterium]
MWKTTSGLKTRKLAIISACAVISPLLLAPLSPSLAQSLNSGNLQAPQVPEGTKLLLAADELTYNQDLDVVIARGGVQIDYGAYQLVARQVEYNQVTGRVRAFGNVELIEPNGNRIFADELDITDNFSDGFVEALRIETPDRTRIAASSAQRSGDNITVLNNGVYTACPKCEKDPTKPPFWQIKAARVIQNDQERTIRFESPVFEIGGVPILRLPSFTIPNHENRRRSGFLIPSAGYSTKLGVFAKVPYYFALAPDMDATVTASGFSQAGFLTEVEFRQKFNKGNHTLLLAGAHQHDPAHFSTFAVPTSPDELETNRGFVASKAEFQLNDKWKLGWNGMLQSDQNFARTYSIEGYDSVRQTSEAYITGLGTTSYFDAHVFKFDVQSDDLAAGTTAENQQAIVYPVVDYHRIFNEGMTGGDLKFTFNTQHLSRELQQVPTYTTRTTGLDGSNGRLTAELEWKKQFVTDFGLVLTPILAARGDFHHFDVNTAPAGLTSGTSASRGTVTAGIEAKYPLLMTAGSSTHVLEPIAQVFARNDEKLSGGLPNEDAQSFVFDASNLFERDKFSGFDRIEGGTRANVGFRYTGSYSNGFTTHAVFGQSFHLGGQNSFAQTDLTGAGADSGLETDRSDFVGAFTVDNGQGFSVTAGARFDKDNFNIERSTLAANYSNTNFSANLSHTKIAAQTGYGSISGEEVTANASLKFADDWRVFGGTTYDIDRKDFTKSSAGLAYENECFIITGVYNHTHSTPTAQSEWDVGLRISFRTLGTLNVGDSAVGREF